MDRGWLRVGDDTDARTNSYASACANRGSERACRDGVAARYHLCGRSGRQA
jgi:hypothetical protein